MPVTYRVKVDEEKVLDRLNRVIPYTMAQIVEATEEVTLAAIETFRDYPPETEANQPPPPYYIRGVGYYGKYGTLTKESEQLGANWSYNIQQRGDDEVVAELDNIASYAAYVHGDENQVQMPWHAQRKWPHALATIATLVGDPDATGLAGATGSSGGVVRGVKDRFKQAIQNVVNWFNR